MSFIEHELPSVRLTHSLGRLGEDSSDSMRNQSMREFRVNWYRVFSRWVGLVLAVDRLAGPLLLLTAQVVFC